MYRFATILHSPQVFGAQTALHAHLGRTKLPYANCSERTEIFAGGRVRWLCITCNTLANDSLSGFPLRCHGIAQFIQNWALVSTGSDCAVSPVLSA